MVGQENYEEIHEENHTRDFVRVLGSDYTIASLLSELTRRHLALVASCGQVKIFERYTRQLADAIRNQGVAVSAALESDTPLTQDHMRAIARHALLQAEQARVIADHAVNQTNNLDSEMEDWTRMVEAMKGILREYPQIQS